MSNTVTAAERCVCFDTETTGLSHKGNDRVVEIACVELRGLMPTGMKFHAYIDPQRDMPEAAFNVHGLSRDFLRGQPLFSDIVADFLQFIGNDTIVAHNAPFDVGFINAELRRIGMEPMENPVVDTVTLARQQFAGAKVTLDGLCRRFGIDLSRRDKHNAMLDTELLAKVYLELCGGRQHVLNTDNIMEAGLAVRPYRAPRNIGAAAPGEIASHVQFLQHIKKPIWSSAMKELPAYSPR